MTAYRTDVIVQEDWIRGTSAEVAVVGQQTVCWTNQVELKRSLVNDWRALKVLCAETVRLII